MNGEHPAVELAARLVAINSENPGPLETEIVTFIADWLARAGVQFQRQQVAPGRHNLIARVEGRGERAPLMLIAHCDTVPVGQGWTLEPFGGLRGGRVVGRGAADMKGGLAAALHAIAEARQAGPPPGDLLVAVTVDEEGGGMQGVMALIQAGIAGADTLVITPEPTSLEIVRSHRGVMWYEIVAHGVMAHGGYADRGVDANHALAEVICELKAAANALPFQDPLVGGTLISVGRMAGGTKTNVVPNLATAEVDLRVPPPFTAEMADRVVERAAARAVARVKGARVEVRPLGLQRAPVETPEGSPVVGALLESCRRVMGKEPVISGYPAYTDAAMISLATGNRDAVLFGPGDLRLAHAIDEWAPAEEIALCAEVFRDLALAR